MMERHFVTFVYPRLAVDEEAEEPVKSWDVEKAIEEAKTRHPGACSFEFHTRRREDDELDSKVVARSPTYFLGGGIITIEEVRGREKNLQQPLLAGMEANGWDRVVVAKFGKTSPLEEEDVVLESA